jgi:3-oxoacyl-(acyl-carrier-protein) synthase
MSGAEPGILIRDSEHKRPCLFTGRHPEFFTDVQVALTNSFGFGGHNTTLALGAYRQ